MKSLTVLIISSLIIGCATQPSDLPTTNLSPNGLPPCPSSGVFHNCFGTYTFINGNEYVGEWEDNKYHGYGTFKFADRDKYVGEYKEGSAWTGNTYDKNGSVVSKLAKGVTTK